uniref:Ubiquitin-like-conjugating enzyme ATG10 n=1 Tax=Oryza barthii TaxID=65489 RepID=A0A0D3HUV4_9ORYZ
MGGSSIGEGTLSLGDFVASAKALIEKWKVIDVEDSLPDWQWKPCGKTGVPSEEEGYLALEGVYRNPGGRHAQSSSESVHIYDYHVVYSFSYKVPVLYFQGHQADISNLFLGGQLLTLDEIKEDLPSHSLKLLGESKWTFITRELNCACTPCRSIPILVGHGSLCIPVEPVTRCIMSPGNLETTEDQLPRSN